MRDSDLVVSNFLSVTGCRESLADFSQSRGAVSMQRKMPMVVNSLGSCRFSLQLCKDGVEDVSE